MGLGDPDHHHPLTFDFLEKDEATCFRCELPIGIIPEQCYGCARCDHFVHRVCFELPDDMRHPLHPQHSLALLPSPNLHMDCNHCHEPCLGGYVYQCQACLQFQLHLKCFLTLNLREKHEHPLSLYEVNLMYGYEDTCRTCGLLIDDSDSYTFGCKDCEFFIHFDCTFLPPTVKRHHVHELTFRYNYPEESDLAICDVCEDDEKELDRLSSYYYCRRCDYIAHVRCVTTKPAIVTTQLGNFVHEHPMIYSRKPRSIIPKCACKISPSFYVSYYFCTQCDYKLHESCAKFPKFIKHPHHKDHTLSLRSLASLNIGGELPVCSFCSCKIDDDALILQCMDCDYAEHLSCAVCFRHPHYAHDLLFSACSDLRFRCNACGELGDGYRMSSNEVFRPSYDLHLECYALPGKIEHGCHSHLLYLISSPTKIRSDLSTTTFCCDVCRTKADSDFWIYCCKQCNYIAHLKCVASDLLSGLGTTNNFSSLCSITECEEGQFIDHVIPDVTTLCSSLKGEHFRLYRGPIFHNGRVPLDVTDWNQSSIDVLHCPKCERPISTPAYSCINDWMYCNFKATIHNQTPIGHEPLALLDEKLIEQLYCQICNQLIFPPTYSCAECQIFFHKSCAELPYEYTKDAGHTFVLLPPSMRIDRLSNCVLCELPIKGYAYVCRSCEIVVDVVCALGAPLHKLEKQKHSLFSWRDHHGTVDTCKACGNPFPRDSIFFKCRVPECYFNLHFECAMLPYTVSHRIHQHPLVLETCLDLSVDDYVCDACEKELNPYLWAYRCSDSCGDRATSHVYCIVTSNKKCQFKYDEGGHYLLGRDVPLVRKMSLRDTATVLAKAAPKKQRKLLRNNLFVLVDKLVDELDHEFASDVTAKLLQLGQAEVLHLIESPDALKEIVKSMEGNRPAAPLRLDKFYCPKII